MPCLRFRSLDPGITVTVRAPGASAEIVTPGGNPPPLPECPFPGLAGLCEIGSATRAVGRVSDFAAIRIGHSGQGGLPIGDGATASRTHTELAPGGPQSLDVVVGDNVHASAALSVGGSGRLSTTEPEAGNGSGGLFVGPVVAAPTVMGQGATSIGTGTLAGRVSNFGGTIQPGCRPARCTSGPASTTTALPTSRSRACAAASASASTCRSTRHRAPGAALAAPPIPLAGTRDSLRHCTRER